MARDGLKVS